ncbi:MAG: MBL fold metallo-hydrolase [Acholeplasmataceae bacterium]|nr:MBL fold metallo-hydrolase [Acholeplasmataceae bacterium]
MEIIKIKGHTFCIDTGMTYIPFYKINDEEIIMLDTGWAAGEQKGITESLQKNALKVVGIINSHAHIDHSGNNSYFREKYGCQIAMPACEAMICSSSINLKLYYNTFALTEIEEHLGHMVCPVDFPIADNQTSVEMCGVEFKIMHTPGHSLGHICLITPDDVAYVGDALISHDVMRGAKMPYASILTKDLESKEKLYELRCSRYVIAHKGIYDDINELITDNINFYQLRAEKIYDLIEKEMTLQELMQKVIKSFNIHVADMYKYNLIERMLRSYLEYLDEKNRIKLILVDGFLKYTN